MELKSKILIALLVIAGMAINSCREDSMDNLQPDPNDSLGYVYDPSPYNLVIPSGFPAMNIPNDNPLTIKGVELGRKLFYDPILSGDGTQACASCHAQAFSFTDNGKKFSLGIDGMEGNRNTMALINLGWQKDMFFWDGRAVSIADQALKPVVNPVEMHNTWPKAIDTLQKHPDYPRWFGEAFNTTVIDSMLVVKAIAQFERTLISGNSKYDRVLYKGEFFTDAEERGYDIYFTEKGDCFHCHGGIYLSDNAFHNNALDSEFDDLGLYETTGDPNDKGLFKAPTLRNIEYTAPYMHDGRFKTLEEVIDHYSDSLVWSPTIDPLMKKINQGGLHLTDQEKSDLLAFLKTLTDEDFINNPKFSNPF